MSASTLTLVIQQPLSHQVKTPAYNSFILFRYKDLNYSKINVIHTGLHL